MEGLKQERFILPSADTLERAGLAGRARARKAAAALIVESLGHAELARIDDLIVNNSDFGMTPLAWLRNFEEAPTTANINGLLERLRDVRSEEHTSELQSLMRISYAVFCLEKKTKKK